MITSSIIAWQNLQVDGRKEVREVHADDQGNEYIFDYMADKDTDIDTKMQQRAIELNTQAADGVY